MAVSKRVKAIYNGFFDGIETFAANSIITFQEQQHLKKYIDKEVSLNREQKEQIREYWAPYCRISPKWALYYSAKNGHFDPRYIPNTLYYTKIDQHFNARKLGYGFNDKNYYSLLFQTANQPDTLVRNIGGLYFDREYRQITFEDAVKLILTQNEVIVKPSQESGSGRGILFFNYDQIDDIRQYLMDKREQNYLVQAIVRQHPALEKIHKGSVNCIRICSILLDDGVHILSSVLRMGFGNSRIDNATAKDNSHFDGVSCGINKNGSLKKYAYGYNTGLRMEKHPDGVEFNNFVIPSYVEAIDMVKECHQRIGNFRLVSWDIAIDSKGVPILIEANMRKGSINFHQFNNGPLFGDLTSRVLDEVFRKK